MMTRFEKKPLIVLGAGGHARVLVSTLKQLGRRILGVTCTSPFRYDDLFEVPIIGGDDKIEKWSPEEIELVNGIGMTKAGQSARHTSASRLRSLGYRFSQVIDPSACIAPEVLVGEGVQVMAGAIIQPGASIGRDSIVNTGAQVDHDCVVGEGSHLCPGSILAGNVQIGKESVVGSGAVIIPGIETDDRRMIRAGSIVTSNVD